LCPAAPTVLREVTLGVPQQVAATGGGDVGSEWRLASVPPPLALDPHVVVGTRDIGQERAARACLPIRLTPTNIKRLEGWHYT
jgi:hypothetical protein